MTSDGHTASYYSTVEQVASSKVTFFLTRYDVPAYTNTEEGEWWSWDIFLSTHIHITCCLEVNAHFALCVNYAFESFASFSITNPLLFLLFLDDGTVSYQKTVVQSGHVLKLLGIFEDLNARRTNSNGRGHDATSSVFSCDKYAQCLNYRNEVSLPPCTIVSYHNQFPLVVYWAFSSEVFWHRVCYFFLQVVFLPFSASGRFYTTAQKSSKNPNHVYLMAHILKNHRLPLTVRLVCGYMPRVPCNFTGERCDVLGAKILSSIIKGPIYWSVNMINSKNEPLQD